LPSARSTITRTSSSYSAAVNAASSSSSTRSFCAFALSARASVIDATRSATS